MDAVLRVDLEAGLAAIVDDFPDAPGPVRSTMPWWYVVNFKSDDGRFSDDNVGASRCTTRNTPSVPLCWR